MPVSTSANTYIGRYRSNTSGTPYPNTNIGTSSCNSNQEIRLPLVSLRPRPIHQIIPNRQPQPLRRRRAIQHQTHPALPIHLPRRPQRLSQCKENR